MNWGLRIGLLYGGFVAGIVAMVVLSTQQQIDLVRTDYYAAELKHQDRIDETANATALNGKVALSRNGEAVNIQLPADLNGKNIKGTAYFYRPSDAKLDLTFPLQPDSTGSQLITGKLTPGIYNVQVQWNCDGKNYFSEVVFTY